MPMPNSGTILTVPMLGGGFNDVVRNSVSHTYTVATV